jgi:hypothetical protein
VGTIFLSPLPGHDEINIPRAAFGTGATAAPNQGRRAGNLAARTFMNLDVLVKGGVRIRDGVILSVGDGQPYNLRTTP